MRIKFQVNRIISMYRIYEFYTTTILKMISRKTRLKFDNITVPSNI